MGESVFVHPVRLHTELEDSAWADVDEHDARYYTETECNTIFAKLAANNTFTGSNTFNNATTTFKNTAGVARVRIDGYGVDKDAILVFALDGSDKWKLFCDDNRDDMFRIYDDLNDTSFMNFNLNAGIDCHKEFKLHANLTCNGAETVDGVDVSSHDHTGVAGHGVQLDVDTCFSDFVHDHSNDAEGGVIPGVPKIYGADQTQASNETDTNLTCVTYVITPLHDHIIVHLDGGLWADSGEHADGYLGCSAPTGGFVRNNELYASAGEDYDISMTPHFLFVAGVNYTKGSSSTFTVYIREEGTGKQYYYSSYIMGFD